MTFEDLTKVNVPFGLLDAVTQSALRAHGGPYEAFYQHGGSYEWDSPALNMNFTSHGALAWRVKPQPPKPREWWISPNGFAYESLEAMEIDYSSQAKPQAIHVQEVLPGDGSGTMGG